MVSERRGSCASVRAAAQPSAPAPTTRILALVVLALGLSDSGYKKTSSVGRQGRGARVAADSTLSSTPQHNARSEGLSTSTHLSMGRLLWHRRALSLRHSE